MEGFKEEKLRVQLQMAWPGDFQRGRLGFRSSSYSFASEVLSEPRLVALEDVNGDCWAAAGAEPRESDFEDLEFDQWRLDRSMV